MATECYAMVRGSAIRVTGLTRKGSLPDFISMAASRSVAQVAVNERAESSNNELLRNEDDEGRLLFVQSGITVRHEVDINLLRCDPGILSIMAGVPVVSNARGEVVGFDSNTRIPAKSFALEVWSQLDTRRGGPRQYGYTVFPFLAGGFLTGFTFANGLVSFNLAGAQTRRAPRWGSGPYDLDGQYKRLLGSVSRNLSFKNQLTSAAPPQQTDGIVVIQDIIDGGSAATTTSDILDGEYAVTSPWTIDGGRAV